MVPRIQNNLSAPGIQHLRWTQIVLMTTTMVCLAFSIGFWWIGQDLHQQIDILEHKAHLIANETRQAITDAKSANIDLSEKAINNIPPKIAFVKQLRKRVGFSWTQLLSDLESALPQGIRMHAVSLDEKTNTVQLNGGTSSLQALTKLLHRLETHEAFHDVILSQHAKKKRKNSTKQSGIIFSMKVSYIPKTNTPKTHEF